MKKQEPYIYSGRQFSKEELLLIREIIAAKDKPHRKEISQRVCRAIGWYRPNGLLNPTFPEITITR